MIRPLPPLEKVASRVYWRGGAPGKETDWNTPENWHTKTVPDYSNAVIIPNVSDTSGHFPVIDCVAMPVGHIHILTGAKLTIAKYGTLLIDGFYLYHNGITNAGRFFNYGDFTILNSAKNCIENDESLFVNCGYITMDTDIVDAIVSDYTTIFVNINKIFTDESLVFMKL